MPAPRKYDDETRARAVRMSQDRVESDGESKLAARKTVGELLGVNPATLRGWGRTRRDRRGSAAGVVQRPGPCQRGASAALTGSMAPERSVSTASGDSGREK